MNFGMLKNMVENLLASYKCPFCLGTTISEKNIDIVGAAGNTVNIDMHCPSCDKHFMARTEIVQMDIGNVPAGKAKDIANALSAIKGKLGGDIEIDIETAETDSNREDGIIDADVMSLHNELKKKNFTTEDLFNYDESGS